MEVQAREYAQVMADLVTTLAGVALERSDGTPDQVEPVPMPPTLCLTTHPRATSEVHQCVAAAVSAIAKTGRTACVVDLGSTDELEYGVVVVEDGNTLVEDELEPGRRLQSTDMECGIEADVAAVFFAEALVDGSQLVDLVCRRQKLGRFTFVHGRAIDPRTLAIAPAFEQLSTALMSVNILLDRSSCHRRGCHNKGLFLSSDALYCGSCVRPLVQFNETAASQFEAIKRTEAYVRRHVDLEEDRAEVYPGTDVAQILPRDESSKQSPAYL